MINLDDKKVKEQHWVSLFIDRNIAVNFDSFEIECIPPAVLNKLKDKSVTHNKLRIQDYGSIICGFYCIALIEYMVTEIFVRLTNLFSPDDYKKIIYKYISILRINIENLEFTLKKNK